MTPILIYGLATHNLHLLETGLLQAIELRSHRYDAIDLHLSTDTGSRMVATMVGYIGANSITIGIIKDKDGSYSFHS